MATLSNAVDAAKSIPAQVASDVKIFDEPVRIEPAKHPEIKDSISSASSASSASTGKTENKKTSWQKVKDCFANVIKWIKKNIFCCCCKDEATVEKKKFEKWFKSLNEKDQKEVNEAIKDFNKVVSKRKSKDELVMIIVAHDMIKTFIKYDKWDQIEDFIGKGGEELKKANLSSEQALELFKEKPSILLNFMDAIKKIGEGSLETTNAIAESLSFLDYIEDNFEENLTPEQKVQIQGVFRKLSLQTRALLVENYKAANQKTEFTQEQLLNFILDKPFDKSLDDTYRKIKDESKKLGKQLEEQFNAELGKALEQAKKLPKAKELASKAEKPQTA